MRIPFLLAVSALLLSSMSLAQSTNLPAVSAHFTVHQGEQSIGTASYQIQPGADGYRIIAHGNLRMQDLAYAFSKTEQLDTNLEIASEGLSGTVNGSAVTVAVHPDNHKLALDISANGQAYQNSLEWHPQTVFVPDFDMSSYVVLLRLAALHPGSALWALIPKQTGILLDAKLDRQPDLQGTFNGASTSVRHFTLTIGSVTSDVYATSKGDVLEVDIPSQGFAVVRDQFQLQPPASPAANPQPAPTQQQ